MEKRKDYIGWDEYFMGVASLSARRSKDPSTQVGACIVDNDNRIVGTGYNGMPKGCNDDGFPWAREGEFLEVLQNGCVLSAVLPSPIRVGAGVWVNTEQ